MFDKKICYIIDEFKIHDVLTAYSFLSLMCNVKALISCEDHQSCYMSASIHDEDIRCYGYRSCELAASISTDSSNGGNIRCFGSYSCYNVDRISGQSSWSLSQVFCYGLSSCANIANIDLNYGRLWCFGEQA